MAGRVWVFPHHRLQHEIMAITKGMRKCVVRAMREPETTTAPGPEPGAPSARRGQGVQPRASLGLFGCVAMPSDRYSSGSARVRPAPSESDKDEIEQKKPSRDRTNRKEDRNGRDVESGNKDADSRGRDKSKKKDGSASGGGCWQRALLAILFFCGPVGTVISFLLLPKDADSTAPLRHSPMGDAPKPGGEHSGLRVRMVHLSLADTDRRARFVLDENTVWETFLAGCRERLQVKNIRKVTDSSGEAILAVEDLVHDDHLVIYATPMAKGDSGPAPPLPASDDLGPTEVPLQGISGAAVVNSKSRFLQNSADEAPTDGNATLADGVGPAVGTGGPRTLSQRLSASLNQLSALTSATASAGIAGRDEDGDGDRDTRETRATHVDDGASYAAQVIANARAEDAKHGIAGHAHGHGHEQHHGHADSSSSSSHDGNGGGETHHHGGGDSSIHHHDGGGGGGEEDHAAAAGGGMATMATPYTIRRTLTAVR